MQKFWLAICFLLLCRFLPIVQGVVLWLGYFLHNHGIQETTILVTKGKSSCPGIGQKVGDGR